jgi:hypothetical protein
MKSSAKNVVNDCFKTVQKDKEEKTRDSLAGLRL